MKTSLAPCSAWISLWLILRCALNELSPAGFLPLSFSSSLSFSFRFDSFHWFPLRIFIFIYFVPLIGILLEIEFLPCIVLHDCRDLMKEVVGGILGSQEQIMIPTAAKPTDLYHPKDKIKLYHEHFTSFRKQVGTGVAATESAGKTWWISFKNFCIMSIIAIFRSSSSLYSRFTISVIVFSPFLFHRHRFMFNIALNAVVVVVPHFVSLASIFPTISS